MRITTGGISEVFGYAFFIFVVIKKGWHHDNSSLTVKYI